MGLHNQGKRVLAVFDEASAIPDVIWETTEGALTDADTEIIWLVCGNPTRNNGRFRECFGRFRHRWLTRQIDSRTARLTNKEQIASWVSDYGEDSDFVRVRVRGEFPRAGSMQFISSEVVEEASRRELMAGLSDALVIGVDIARHGEDQSVIFFRRGRDARSIPPIKLRLPDTMQVAAKVAEEARRLSVDAVFVDATGMGWAVFDRLNQLGVPNVFAIEFSRSPDRVNFDDPIKTANNQFHVERSADVILLVDTFVNIGQRPHSTLDFTLRAAAGLAQAYLRQTDRVGLIEVGGWLRWTKPASGPRQYETILRSLTRATVTATDLRRDAPDLPEAMLPRHALIIAITPLADERFVHVVTGLADQGRDVVLLAIGGDEVSLPYLTGRAGYPVVRRVWRLLREDRLRELRSHGMRAALWSPAQPIEAALASVERHVTRGAAWFG